MDKPSFEERVASGEGTVSLINAPLNYEVDFEVKATEIARRRWRCEPELIDGDRHD
jgi:hypothetical protein